MKIDFSKEIKIDQTGRLCIFPEKDRFAMIYRLAKEVHWDNNGLFLFSPLPREWSYLDWYKHMLNVVNECNCNLLLTPNTAWTNISVELKEEILAS